MNDRIPKPFDIVTIARADRVQFLYCEKPRDFQLEGWSVSSISGDWALLFGQSIVIRIPIADVIIEAIYSIDNVIDHLRRIDGYGTEPTEKGKKHTCSEEGDPRFFAEE